MIQLPERLLPPKPRFKEACNGCGLCCHLEICNLGSMAFPDAEAPCPGLLVAGGRTWCKLVLTEKIHELPPTVQKVLGIGNGCMMADDEYLLGENAQLPEPPPVQVSADGGLQAAASKHAA